ncbi:MULTISPECIES: hypothetical protein [Limosilactobacillus]|uniref:Phage holin n=1 Tax=Candidatus Companilactobacillus pullicola TaxID=2838523 RepID=A0A9D2CMQ4_9LACO|nr:MULTISPECIES: hypothetical protein [Limosilactobacillus]MCD7133507.1 hypothetical protein [Limosilactobacillus balticus]UFK66609.1 hypothetical protein IU404_02058 [Limosilactobacillus reuteri]UFK67130.1 hypothetical protein IVR12_00074 [Limosilactobacillus reuteri]HIY92175.1 hypothetical protein [Candidatus Companilactobacillus pullicola]
MSTIINAIPTYIMTAVISTVFYFALKQSQTFIHAKVTHAKTETSRAAWSCAERLADNAVASLVGKDMAGHEKFHQATGIVQQALQKQGIKNIDLNAIETLVQSAYEKSALTPTVDPTSQPTKPATIPAGQAPAIDPMKGEE